jgi:hypothetical protein
MQINDKQWGSTYDMSRIKSDWKYNVDCGVEIARNEYNAAVAAKEQDFVKATYSGYNGGRGALDRYRTGNDPRDTKFYDFYTNKNWLK